MGCALYPGDICVDQIRATCFVACGFGIAKICTRRLLPWNINDPRRFREETLR